MESKDQDANVEEAAITALVDGASSSISIETAVKIMTIGSGTLKQAPDGRPMLDRDDNMQKSVRSGMLRLQIESSSVLFGKVRSWREKFVHIDETEGIFFCNNRDSFEKMDRKAIKILPFSDIAGVLLRKPDETIHGGSLHHCRFVVYVKPRARPMFGAEIELETPAGLQEAEEWVQALRQKILVKARVYTVGLNGEFPEHARGVRPNVAVCFSGGGGRAHVCAAAEMRALHYLGLLDKSKIDYLSGVSAGAWATAIYTFYEKGAESDEELFGPLESLDLKKWNLATLENNPIPPILQPALQSTLKVASELVWTINSHELWERVMGKIFLKPFGLNKDWPYCLREDLEAIKRENPHLQNTRFVMPKKDSRPFWICHGTIIGPEWAKLGDLLPIQFTPLYSGSPYLHKIHYTDKLKEQEEVVWVGGGMVDSFAFGGEEPSSIEHGSQKLKNRSPRATVATSSASSSKMSSSGSFFWRSGSSRRHGEKRNSLSLASKALLISPAAQAAALIPLASKAFADAVREQAVEAGLQLKQRAVPMYSNDITDAVSTLNLAPFMIHRVFRHAKEALQSTEFYTPNKESKDHSNEGVLAKQVSLPYPEVPFSIRHTLGISSDAPSVNLHEKAAFRRLNVQERYWTPVFVSSPEDPKPSATDLTSPTAASMAGNTESEQSKVATVAGASDQLNITQSIATTHAVTMDMGDGGTLDNLGLCGMLQRKVRKIIVFVNTKNIIPSPYSHRAESKGKIWDANRRLSITKMAYDALFDNAPNVPSVATGESTPRDGSSGGEPDRTATPPRNTRPPSFAKNDAPTYEEWPDEDILPLFGQNVSTKLLNYLGSHHDHNHVFPLTELRPLLRKFQTQLMQGLPTIVRQEHEVLDNAFWGIEGGWKVDVLWVYLDDCSVFRSMLPDDTMQELDKAKGELYRFPNFKTFGTNNRSVSIDISLTVKQTNLLSVYSEWQIMHQKELFLDFVQEPLAPLERKKKKQETFVKQLEAEGFC